MDPKANRFRYEYMRLEKIRAILKRCPVAIVPSGLLEWHGEHNAIGLDGLKAYYICERAIQLLGDGVLLPINWIGTYGFIRYPGTICYTNLTTFTVFSEMINELVKLGFKVIFVLTGHYGHYQMKELGRAVKRCSNQARENGQDVCIAGYKPPDLIPSSFGGDHARQYETSMLMRVGEAWGIDLVDVSGCIEGIEQVEQYKIEDDLIPMREPDEWVWDHDLKNTSICSAGFGEKLIDNMTRGMVLEILEMCESVGIDYQPPNPVPFPDLNSNSTTS